jgi:hypothetical protein
VNNAATSPDVIDKKSAWYQPTDEKWCASGIIQLRFGALSKYQDSCEDAPAIVPTKPEIMTAVRCFALRPISKID